MDTPGRRTTRPAPGQRRIGLFTDDFYPASGGVGRSIELQLHELVRRGHHVTLFAPRVGFEPPEVGDYVTLPSLRLPGTPSYLCSLRFEVGLARRIVREFAFDVVHSQNERGSLLLAARIARAQGVRHVHTFHSNYAGTHVNHPASSALSSLFFLPTIPRLLAGVAGRPPGEVRRPQRGVAVEDSVFARSDWRNLARLATLVDAYTTPAGFVHEAIDEATDGALAGRGFVIPSGVSDHFARAERRRPVQETVRFVSCGRLGAEKRVDVIVRAMVELDRPDAELVVIGEGPEADRLRALADGASDRIRFVGFVPEVPRVAREIADADVFVLASYHFDTQGMVLGEAAAAGTAILYCDDRLTVGVGPANALLTGPTVASVARGMRVLLDDRDRLRAMAAASRELAPQLSTAAMGARYEEAYGFRA